MARVSRLWVLPVLAGFAAAGCVARPGPTSPPAAAVSSATGTAAAGGAEPGRQALAAYRGMWRAYGQAVQVPDPSSPQLPRYATADALATLTTGLQSLKDQGLKGTGDIEVNPTITAAAPTDHPTEVEVTDCLDSSRSHIVRASPGPAYHDPPGGHRRVIATVKRQPDGAWKVASFAAQVVGTCV